MFLCDVRFWRENEKKKFFFVVANIWITFSLSNAQTHVTVGITRLVWFRSQSNDGKKGKKRTTADAPPSSSARNHSSSSKVTVTSNHARNHKSNKSNTKPNTNLTKNLDNNGAGSLSIGSGPSVASSNVHSSTNSTHTTSTTTTTQSQSAIVKLSPAPSSTGSARTSSPIVNVTIMKKYRDEPSTSRTPDMPFASIPTAGGLKFAFEQQQQPQAPAGLVINTNTTALHHVMKESPPSSPGSEASARKRRKGGGNSLTPQPSPHTFHGDHKEKDSKAILQNGAIPLATHHMLGNQLNPNSSVAKNMTETLNMEIEAHSIYSHEPAANLVGPQYPGRKDSVRFLILRFIAQFLTLQPSRASNRHQHRQRQPHRARRHSPQC